MTDTIDSKIRELLDVVATQKTAVQKAEKEASSKWKTTASFPSISSTVNINLQTANEALVQNVVIEILQHRDYANRAAKELDLPAVTKYANFDYEDWITDCKTRIAKLHLAEKKTKLSDLEKRLDAIVSPEQRRQIELESIMKDLG